jgi:hypothetical protein
LFDPQQIPPSETPIDPNDWPISISIALYPMSEFEEVRDYYFPAFPAGLDPARWKLWGADFSASILVETQDGTERLYGGSQAFVIAEDLSKTAGDAAWMRIYRWRDLGPANATTESWTRLKWFMLAPANPEGAAPDLPARASAHQDDLALTPLAGELQAAEIDARCYFDALLVAAVPLDHVTARWPRHVD